MYTRHAVILFLHSIPSAAKDIDIRTKDLGVFATGLGRHPKGTTSVSPRFTQRHRSMAVGQTRHRLWVSRPRGRYVTENNERTRKEIKTTSGRWLLQTPTKSTATPRPKLETPCPGQTTPHFHPSTPEITNSVPPTIISSSQSSPSPAHPPPPNRTLHCAGSAAILHNGASCFSFLSTHAAQYVAALTFASNGLNMAFLLLAESANVRSQCAHRSGCCERCE